MRKPLTVAEYLTGPETMRPTELVYGVVREPQSPFVSHQAVVTELSALLHAHVQSHRRGRVFVSPLDVVLDEKRALVVQPDIIFVSASRAGILRNQIWGAPDLVVEVLSAGTARRDRTEKLRWYRRYGVRECWLVDQRAQRMEVLDLTTRGRAPSRRVFSGDQQICSLVLPAFSLTARRLFE